MIRHLFFIIALLFVASCSLPKQRNESNAFELTGIIKNASHTDLLFQELSTRELLTLDTITTNHNGVFSYEGLTREAGFYILRIDERNYITLLIEPGEKIHIRADAEKLLNNYSVSGSEGSILLSRLFSVLQPNNEKYDSLKVLYDANRQDENCEQIHARLKEEYDKVYDDQQQKVQRFINKNPRSIASIIALYQFFGNRLLLNEKDHFEYFESLSGSLSEIYPTNKHVMELNRRVGRHKRDGLKSNNNQDEIAIGRKAPEINLPDPEGNNIALSSLKGQYVLVDFWASWCKPCRQANQKLTKLYDQYSSLGFEIYAISLDRNREKWLQGIDEDGVNWMQVSDLRLWNSPVVSLYGVERIPYTLLLNPDGIIINQEISIEELEKFLADNLIESQ